MLGDPLLHLDGKPEGVNTEGDDGQKHPLDVVAKELRALAVKGQTVTVDHGVLDVPSLYKI